MRGYTATYRETFEGDIMIKTIYRLEWRNEYMTKDEPPITKNFTHPMRALRKYNELVQRDKVKDITYREIKNYSILDVKRLIKNKGIKL